MRNNFKEFSGQPAAIPTVRHAGVPLVPLAIVAEASAGERKVAVSTSRSTTGQSVSTSTACTPRPRCLKRLKKPPSCGGGESISAMTLT